MTNLQTITNQIYGVVANQAVRTVVFPSGSTPLTYSCVLTNVADNKIGEQYFHVDVHATEVPLYFGLKSFNIELRINIYDFGKEPTGSQRPMMLVDQILAALRTEMTVAEMGSSDFNPIGYTDGQDHFQYLYTTTFTTLNP